jgi:hypothetical protein
MTGWIPSSRVDFSLPNNVQTGSDYRSSFQGIMRPKGALNTYLHLVPMIRMSGAISLLPLYCSWHANRHLLTFVNYILNITLFSYFDCCLLAHCRCRGLLLHLVTINDTHTHSVGLLWMNDRPVAKTST